MRPDHVLIAILASYNRRALTLRALERFFVAADAGGLNARAVLFDDGSADGTADAVEGQFGARTEVLRGDGSKFWAASMQASEARAIALAKELDARRYTLFWLNDDVDADADALVRLLKVQSDNPDRILVGSTRDPESGEVTYGGMRRSGAHPLAFALVEPATDPEPVDAMNGNVVLVPDTVVAALGGLDGGFSHALADIDLATRAARAGVPALLAPGTYGTCARNPEPHYRSASEAWRGFTGVKGGGNPRSTARILRRLAPIAWPFWWSATYAKWCMRAGSRFGAARPAALGAPSEDRA
ncbi:glycosyltransferase family 2 protein [Demequina gelatinilytica]|uniref:glycosyltransferase family 2 protein n=1 Tax=Demequina gelatinilytica TaxID=1638980 RepID=UPI0007831A41|nr:glycosyltransferase [Demequina gelatinilytica]